MSVEPEWIEIDGRLINLTMVAAITPMVVGGIEIMFSGGGTIRVPNWKETRRQLSQQLKIVLQRQGAGE